jgi:hypothetical protein
MVGLNLFRTSHGGTEGRLGYRSFQSQHRRYVEVNGKLHARAALPTREAIPVRIVGFQSRCGRGWK